MFIISLKIILYLLNQDYFQTNKRTNECHEGIANLAHVSTTNQMNKYHKFTANQMPQSNTIYLVAPYFSPRIIYDLSLND